MPVGRPNAHSDILIPRMLWILLISLTLAASIAFIAMFPIRALSVRSRFLDSPGARGHHKDLRSVPNTGGIAITLAVVLPILVSVVLAQWADSFSGESQGLLGWLQKHAAGIQMRTSMGVALLFAVALLHGVGLIDDRRSLSPGLKMGAILVATLTLIIAFDLRILSAADGLVGGAWLSILLTLLWFAAVTNAVNFLDNTDGVCAAVATVASLSIAALALLAGQWFVAILAALLAGALLGFFIWNRPPARIFMGDGGSLVVGFLLAFLTIRLTYVGVGETGGLDAEMVAIFVPVFLLGVPLYDLAAVSLLRVLQRRSPLVGDQQHITHRLMHRGLSAYGVIGFLTVCALFGSAIAFGLSLVTGPLAYAVLTAGIMGFVTLFLWDLPVLRQFHRAGVRA